MAASEKIPGGTRSEGAEPTKQGPPNPESSRDIDMPSPPGGPLRSDAPSGPVPPGGPGTPNMPGEPKEVERPTRSVVEPGSTTADPSEVLTGEDNAQTSQAEPSDDSGSE
ncbi:MAG TPA: hypothetical protein VFY11_13815 [Nocardioidaceae bacterium]|nr:hypothetical protein [Nocardioidaceae bacterium]